MTQTQEPSCIVRRATEAINTTAALVESQMKIAKGLALHGLIAGVAIGLGVPLIVLSLAPSSEWMRWVVVCCAAITGSGIIIASLFVVIVGYLRTSRCLGKILERDASPKHPTDLQPGSIAGRPSMPPIRLQRRVQIGCRQTKGAPS